MGRKVRPSRLLVLTGLLVAADGKYDFDGSAGGLCMFQVSISIKLPVTFDQNLIASKRVSH